MSLSIWPWNLFCQISEFELPVNFFGATAKVLTCLRKPERIGSNAAMGMLNVKRGLLPIKAHYFLLNGAHAGVLPFITVYGKQMGISAEVIGLIMAILCCVTVVSRPLIGSMVDHFQKLKLVMVFLVFVDIAADMGLNFIPPRAVTHSSNGSLFCYQNQSYLIQFRNDDCAKNSSVCETDCVVSCSLCLSHSTICTEDSISNNKIKNPTYNRRERLYEPYQLPDCFERLRLECDVNSTTTCNDEWFDVYGHKFCHQNQSYLIQFRNNDCAKNYSVCETDCVVSCSLCLSHSSICTEGFIFNNNKIKNLIHNQRERLYEPYHLPSCFERLRVECDVNSTTTCNDDLFDVYGYNHHNSSTNPTLQLCLLGIFTAIIYICNGSLVSLSDAACFNALGKKPELYGKQRMFGTIGWGSFALLAGYLNQLFTGASSKYSYSAGFYMLALLFVIDLLVISKLKLEDVKVSKNIFKDVGKLLLKPRIAIFVLQVYFVGIFIGMSRSYVFWYLRSLDASQFILGCSSAVQCFLGELPFFFFAGWIIAKIGHVNTLTMSFLANGLKLLSYSFLENPWLGLPIEFLQGPCFGTFYTAMTSYAKIIAPEGTEATVQGLASGTFEGLGVATGSLIGGYGFRNFGGRATFFWTGMTAFVCAGVNFVVQCTLNRKNTSK
ncbi:MFS_1_like domain-containing protein [Caerostris extrusa]|uniref:MFS_1_like domain-containing protein n=1 Tax=Caerostris extrusa TaxID=172846 RepID=A0AAV4T4T2_CAEEX|nr:MFS_1_like domain-containing protein [Caerostris extrusa]